MYKRCTSKQCDYRSQNFGETRCPHCDHDLVIRLERGDRLGSYVIRESLRSGEGGMGMVYRARHSVHHGNVAIKVAHGRRFQFDALYRETDCLAQLDHPGIVKLIPLDDSEAKQHPYVHKLYLMGEPIDYIVLKFIKGHTFKDLLAEQGKPTLAEAIRVVSLVAEALEHAHERHVIHLDVKPANIMIENETGQPILMDFGISRRLDRQSELIKEKNVGTAGYMAPEHIRGEAVDERADIFSLGVVLYELLTDAKGGPFRRATTRETLQAELEQEPPLLSSVAPELGKHWDAFFAKALAKRPGDRFRTMADFRKALSKMAPSPATRRTPVLIAVVVGVVMLAVLVALLALGGKPPLPEIVPALSSPTSASRPALGDKTASQTPAPSISITYTSDTPSPAPGVQVTPATIIQWTPAATPTRRATATLAP